MSFLDNLEDSVKAQESLEPGGLDDSGRRDADRERAIAAAPWADRLKRGPYVQTLMRDLTRAGFARRIKVNLVWIGTTLRAEARGQRLELEPTPNGVEAVFPDRRVDVDLDGEPDELIQEWLRMLDLNLREQERVRAREAETAEIEE